MYKNITITIPISIDANVPIEDVTKDILDTFRIKGYIKKASHVGDNKIYEWEFLGKPIIKTT